MFLFAERYCGKSWWQVVEKMKLRKPEIELRWMLGKASGKYYHQYHNVQGVPTGIYLRMLHKWLTGMWGKAEKSNKYKEQPFTPSRTTQLYFLMEVRILSCSPASLRLAILLWMSWDFRSPHLLSTGQTGVIHHVWIYAVQRIKSHMLGKGYQLSYIPSLQVRNLIEKWME